MGGGTRLELDGGAGWPINSILKTGDSMSLQRPAFVERREEMYCGVVVW